MHELQSIILIFHGTSWHATAAPLCGECAPAQPRHAVWRPAGKMSARPPSCSAAHPRARQTVNACRYLSSRRSR
eukprot:973387-Prymnesium_polylepis.2